MTDNMNTETLTPTLSLDIDDVPAVKELEPKDAEAFRLQKFSPEEMKQINDFSQKIAYWYLYVLKYSEDCRYPGPMHSVREIVS